MIVINGEKYLSRVEAAKKVGVTTARFDRLVRDGEFEKYTSGKRPVYLENDIIKYLTPVLSKN